MDEPSIPVCYEIRVRGLPGGTLLGAFPGLRAGGRNRDRAHQLHNARLVAYIVRSSRKWLITGMAASEISDRTFLNKSIFTKTERSIS